MGGIASRYGNPPLIAAFWPQIVESNPAGSAAFKFFELKGVIPVLLIPAPFLFPVVIDDTPDATARVPDKFREVQWTRLNVKDTPASLAARVARLLGDGGPAEIARAARQAAGAAAEKKTSPAWLRHAWAIFGLLIGLFYAVRPLWTSGDSHRKPAAAPMASGVAKPAPPSEARQLARRARAMSIDQYDSTADDFATAEGLLKQALALDQNDPEIWAFSSLFNTAMRTRGFDHAPVRRELARRDAERALKLAPDSLTALFALGRAQRDFEPEAAEATFKKILTRDPANAEAISNLAWIDDGNGRPDEAAALYDRALAADPAHAALNRYTAFLSAFHYGRFEEADRAIRRSIAIQPSANSEGGLAMLLLSWKGDADGAARALASGPATAHNEPRTIWMMAFVQLCRRAPDDVIKTLDRLADDYIQDNWFAGPKAYFAGRAHVLAGRNEAARVAFQTALTITNARLKEDPSNLFDHLRRGELLAYLGQPDEALHEARAVAELARSREWYWFGSPVLIYAALGRVDDAMPLLEKLCHAPPNQIVGWPLSPALLRVDPLWDKIRDDPRFQKLAASDQPGANAAPAAKADDKSVAVLAFANLSDDKGNEYFSDGISEELLNVLAKIPGLKVAARTSAFYFKDKNVPIPEVAQKLGVAYVVEGSVRKAGNQVRITAQLINAADGFHVWSDTFTRELKDIFAVQDEIAGLIAQNLQLKMGGAPRVARTVDPEAHRLVLEGRYFWNLRNDEGFARAETAFVKAIEIDPKYAEAHSGLAGVCVIRGQYRVLDGYDANPADTGRARAEAQRAIDLEPTLAEPHAVLGYGLLFENRLAESEQEFQRALALNPNDPVVRCWHANILTAMGRIDQSLPEYEKTAELDPLWFINYQVYLRVLVLAQRYGDALNAATRAAALRTETDIFIPSLGYVAEASLALGRKDEAVETARQVRRNGELRPRWDADAHAIFVLREAGFGREAEDYAKEVFARLPSASYMRGYILAALGHFDEALPFLEQPQPGSLPGIYWGTMWDRWREDPRFGQILAKNGRTEEYKVARAMLAQMLQERATKK